MEGVLDTTLFLCMCKLTCSAIFYPVVAQTITAVSLCCSCLLLFTDLAITLFLVYVRLAESWMTPSQVSSDVVALRFLLFLCQAYGFVLLLMPPLIAVELLVNLLHPQKERTEGKDTETELAEGDTSRQRHQSESLSRTMGFLGCLLAWSVSGICSSQNWMRGQLSVEACLEGGGCLVTCLPCVFNASSSGMDEISWVLPAMVLMLSLTGSLGLLRTKLAHTVPDSPKNTSAATWGKRKDSVALGLMQIQWPTFDRTAVPNASQSPGTDTKKTADSCAVHRAEFVYNEQLWFCHGSTVLCTYQTGLADSCMQKQKQLTSHAPFSNSKTELLLRVTSIELNTVEHYVYNRTDPVLRQALQTQRWWSWHHKRDNTCLGGEMFTLVCVVLVCVFPTVVSGNIVLILNLENLVVYTLKLIFLPIT
ncbi:uncharacterized protein LOC127427892 [Myxocyprinus asiaticus]|uniref:uncharacterized protein LOC127427892 n=1 Tax=Myxocyprinus asiaticus TaxID=70543 RepID=UPI002222A9DC|nr:uncharacterized protein LOC127427892 [Myxocyprinus asiaticus]